MAILADSINNNGIYAVRAESDMDGNRIDTTYAKKTEVPSKTSDLTNDSHFVTSGELATVASTGLYTDLSNKPDLSVYATTSAMETALAGKQSTIPDLDTIRAGASAGATAAQPSDLPSSDELVPSATSGDAGKVLTVDNQGNPSWVTPSAGTVYTAGDGIAIDGNNAISADVDGTTIGIDSTTKKIKSLQVIPTKTSDLQNDSNFVVASSLATVATSGSYADLSNKPTIPSVDQTYNASSTNAQSGTAVAGALSTVNQVPASTSSDENKVLTVNSSGTPVWAVAQGGGSYTAGDGIAIESSEISVDYDSNTLDTVVGVSTESVTAVNHSNYGDFLVLPTDIGNMATGSDNVQITLHIPGNTFYFASPANLFSYYEAHVGFAPLMTSQTTGNLILDSYIQYLAVNLTGTYDSTAQKGWLDEQDVSITLPISETNNWVYDLNPGDVINGLVFSLYDQNQPIYYDLLFKCDANTLTNPVTFTYSGGSHEILTVKNPLPASVQADAGKVLKVNALGVAEWGTDGFTTTAGVTDIQVVNALPASPVATVLYLVTEA